MTPWVAEISPLPGSLPQASRAIGDARGRRGSLLRARGRATGAGGRGRAPQDGAAQRPHRAHLLCQKWREGAQADLGTRRSLPPSPSPPLRVCGATTASRAASRPVGSPAAHAAWRGEGHRREEGPRSTPARAARRDEGWGGVPPGRRHRIHTGPCHAEGCRREREDREAPLG